MDSSADWEKKCVVCLVVAKLKKVFDHSRNRSTCGSGSSEAGDCDCGFFFFVDSGADESVMDSVLAKQQGQCLLTL